MALKTPASITNMGQLLNGPTHAQRKPVFVLCLLLLTIGCASVETDDPKTTKNSPAVGILQLGDGKQIAVLPENLNFTGEATYTWPDGREQRGYWVEGQLQGMGTEQSASERYSGQWVNGERHGHGELQRSDGSRYVGDFRHNLPEGKGTQTADSGVYQGIWQAGKRHGQGQFNAADGAIYFGQWEQDRRSGYGRQQFANGGVYEGDWANNKPHGFGRFLFPTGALYEGHWQAGVRHGYGVWTNPANLNYEGTWQEDKRHGFGKESRPDGSSFTGQWLADQRHGRGIEANADGSQHDGEWKHDQIDGRGARTNTLGIEITGQWQGDKITTGRLTLPSGKSYEGELFSADGLHTNQALVTWLTNLAGQSDPHAQLFLAHVYSAFEQPPPQPQTAKIWLSQAADAGLPQAQYRLALITLPEDAARALELLAQAAAAGHPRANQLLGEYQHTGQYLNKDLAAAIQHYEAAAAGGNMAATNNLAWLLATTADTGTADPQRAITLIRPLVLYLGDWQHLDTLAAAHARMGDYEAARKMQNQALIQARASADDTILDAMTERLTLYSQKQAYIE